jgi:hypothetical protein
MAYWEAISSTFQGVALETPSQPYWEAISSHYVNVPLQSTQPPGEWEKLDSRSVNVPMGTGQPPGEWEKLTDGQTFKVSTGFSIPTGFEIVDEEVFPAGETYKGPAQRCTASFSFLPANWPGVKWFIDKLFANKVKQAVQDSGEQILTYKLYEKGIDYYIVVEATNSAKAYVGLAWTPIIIAALALAGLVVLFLTITSIEDFIYDVTGGGADAGKTITKWGLIALGIAGVTVIGIALFKKPSSQTQKKPT